MTSAEPYAPGEAELIGCYAGAMEEQSGENYDAAKADAERGIAKIKADALRGAVRDAKECWHDPERDGIPMWWIETRADEVEEEA